MARSLSTSPHYLLVTHQGTMYLREDSPVQQLATVPAPAYAPLDEQYTAEQFEREVVVPLQATKNAPPRGDDVNFGRGVVSDGVLWCRMAFCH